MASSNPEDAMMDLPDFIRAIQIQLIQSQEERESQELDPLFQVEKLTIEANVLVSENASTNLGFDIKVLTFGAGVDIENQRTQRIKLELSTKEGESELPGKFPHKQHLSDEVIGEIREDIQNNE